MFLRKKLPKLIDQLCSRESCFSQICVISKRQTDSNVLLQIEKTLSRDDITVL